MKLNDSAYILIPINSFKEASYKDGSHSVILKNGTTLVGQLISQIKTDDDVYDMRSARRIRIVNYVQSSTPKKALEKTWRLISTNPQLTEFIIAEPKFFFGFNYKEKVTHDIVWYSWETRTGYYTTGSFTIKVGDREISTNLRDFNKVSLSTDQQPIGNIEVSSPSGITTSGSLILKYENHDTDESLGWALVARLPTMANTELVLFMPNVSFLR